MNARTSSSADSTKRRSLPTSESPMTALCHTSRLPTSAIETLNFWRTRSLTRRTTERFSFREWLPATKIVTRAIPRVTGSSSLAALPRRVLERRGDGLHLEGLDDVALADVVVALDADAALVALRDLARVVLETAQRADLARVDDDRVAHEPDLGLARDLALGDEGARDRARLGDVEDLAHLDLAHELLARDRGEHAHHGLLDVVDGVVDDLVELDVDALLLGELLGLARGPHAEADGDCGPGPR